MIISNFKFDGSTLYFNFKISLFRSAVITHKLMLLCLWVQLCEDTGEASLCRSIYNKFGFSVGIEVKICHNGTSAGGDRLLHLFDHVKLRN